MEEEEKKTRFKADAKQLVDMLFDNRMINDTVTRDQMNIFEDLIKFTLTARYESHLRCEKLMESLKKVDKK